MCDWCRDSIPPSTLVTDISGTLKFCSFLCLNKYKMNLFCMEAQQHLPLQKEMEIKANRFLSDKKMLITPDLWLSDVNLGDHRQERKKHSNKDPSFPGKSRSICTTDSTQKFHDKYFLNNTAPKHFFNQLRKRHKNGSVPGIKGSKDKPQQHNQHGLKALKSSEETPINHTQINQTNQPCYAPYPSNLSNLFFPHQPSTSATFLFDVPQNQRNPKPFFTPQIMNTLPPGNLMQWPLLLPIPIPVPIPIFIKKDIETTSSEFKHISKSPTQNVEPNCLNNHVIDFSMRKGARSTSVPSQNLQQSELDAHPMTSHKIKTEPEESENLSTKPFRSNTDTKTSYAERRSLILDAPPPAKANPSLSCNQAPRRFSLNRKRCYSVHIKTK